jgi:hypothetical protein
MDDTAKLIAMILLASFAMERIIATANYLLDSERLSRLRHPLAARMQTKERRKMLLLALAGSIALFVIDAADLRIVRLLNGGKAPPLLDYWLTWLILFTGADRARDLLQGKKTSGVPAATTKTPAVRIVVDQDKPVVHELQRVS